MHKISMAIIGGLTLASQNVLAVDQLDPKCEAALALSALPKNLRAEASVFVMGKNGFNKFKVGKGPFTCIVERNHPRSIIPQCLDEQGAELMIPAIMYKSELAMKGARPSEIKAKFKARADAGDFKAPDALGVNYMTSAYNYIYLQPIDRIATIPPHLMHYAPNTSNEDIGAADKAQQRRLPHINEAGIHGYYISFVETPSDRTDVQKACGSQFETTPEA